MQELLWKFIEAADIRVRMVTALIIDGGSSNRKWEIVFHIFEKAEYEKRKGSDKEWFLCERKDGIGLQRGCCAFV